MVKLFWKNYNLYVTTISQRTDWRTDETDDFAVAIPRSAIKILNTDNWIQWSGTDSSPLGVVTRCCTACLAVTVSKECGGTARHWCYPTWSCHSGAETAPLVAWETENRFQIGGACFQVIAFAWSCSTLHVGRLSTRHGHGTYVDISGLSTSTSCVSSRRHSHRLATGVSL